MVGCLQQPAQPTQPNSAGPAGQPDSAARLRSDPQVRAVLPQLERKVAEGELSPTVAVENIATVLGL